MRSLFWKIFLWFWVTVVLVGVALVITWNLLPEVVVNRWRTVTGDAISIYAQSAGEEMDRAGETALAKYLERLDASAHIRAALLDDHGDPLAGRKPELADALLQPALESDQPSFIVRGGRAYAAKKLVGPSGKVYVFVAVMPRGPFGAFHPDLRTQLLRWAVAIVVSGLICYLLTHYLTLPILRLRTASRQLAAGDLGARAEPQMEHRRDEIGDLVRDFNRMADRLESLVSSQRQLISDVSHELRSPLARLQVALGLARRQSDANLAGPLDRIEREAVRLDELIGKVLSLASMDAAYGPAEAEPVDLVEALRGVTGDAEFEAQQRGCRVRLAVAAGAEQCAVIGYGELLRSAVENVVRNAIRYTAAGSVVEVELTTAGVEAVVTVRDHGPGVPEAELQNVFRPFYRVHEARERQSGGTGLGLAITDRALRLHDGTAVAANAGGGGLLVTLRLPCAIRRSTAG